MADNIIQVKLLRSEAKIPTRAYNSAGYDLYTPDNYSIAPLQRIGIPIGLSMEFSSDMVALIWAKSGVGSRGLICLAGVIDSDFRGEWVIFLYNSSSEIVRFEVGQKIAQVLFQRIETPTLCVVENLSDTARGTSSGMVFRRKSCGEETG